MLRLLLVLSFLTALGALLVGQLIVKPKVDELNSTLASTQSQLTETQTAKSAAEKKAKEAEAVAQAATKQVSELKTSLEEVTGTASAQRQRADKLAEQLDATTKTRNEVQAELSKWLALGIKPDEIIKIKDDARRAKEELAETRTVNTALDRRVRYVENRLQKYEEPNREVVLPKGLQGSVTEVGATKDFVFLDIGANHGVLERGKLIVRRGDKLITKVQIVTVGAEKSIANIIKEWNQGDVAVQVGDRVLF